MFLEGKVVEEVVSGVIEAARKQHWLKRLFSNFKKKHRILVLGSSGVGKTSVIEYLRTISPEAIDYMSRTEFAGRRKIRIQDEPFVFVDTPGQIGHQARRMSAIREEMSAGISGVLNVVA
jgi:GTPase SAR1 family protein